MREKSGESEQSIASQRPRSSVSADAIQRDEVRVPANQSLVLVAERELLAALSEQAPLAFGAHPHPSPEETAAFNRAVQALCHEAHRLDLRAEELVIAIKQAWSQLAAVRKSRLGERDSDVLRRVVSSSIEVFFESRDADGRRAQLPEQQTE